jgi:S-adenosylmethionine:tRNA ribosyltransferase-isomerase
VRLEDFDYELPPDRIAQHPAARRDDARMLLLERDPSHAGRGEAAPPNAPAAPDKAASAAPERPGAEPPPGTPARWRDLYFRDLPGLLHAGDVLVFNNTRVLPARLFGYRRGARAYPLPGRRNPARHKFLHGAVEVLLVRRLTDDIWEALVRPGRKLQVGETIVFGQAPAAASRAAAADDAENSPPLVAVITGRGEFGVRQLRLQWHGDLYDVLQRIGHVPLPPYIRRPRNAPDNPEDRERYQTVYARVPGSAAAPTAGLHFTPEILSALEARGIERVEITLDVGLGTFQPVRAEEIEGHSMHEERYCVSVDAASSINRAYREGRRVIAVGTTVVRTLESVFDGGRVHGGEGETDIFIHPGRPVRSVQGLLTNFHLPRSTLLMLVAAFAGRERVLAAYRHAVAAGYRFYSYGDCMLIL